jgi:hypothetical protein
MGAPVCLVKWLATRHSEVERIYAGMGHSIALHLVDACSSQQVFEGIAGWAEGNEAAQCLYLAAHGRQAGADGPFVGLDPGEGDDWITWLQLADELVKLPTAPVLWLGACGSTEALDALGQALTAGHLPAAWVVAFEGKVFSAILEATVQQALRNMRLDDIVFVEEELPTLRAAAGIAAKMFYPAHTRDTKRHEYVSVEEFTTRVGCSFEDFMKRGGHC